MRILVAEDNAVNQKVALRILEKLGYRADAVADGNEAVKALETIPYDLVLMDVQMPVMDGFEATRRIRDLDSSSVLRRDIPIVAMTAHALKGDRGRCLEAGMDGYVSKPVTPLALGEVLDKYLSDASTAGPPDEDRAEPEIAAEAPVLLERVRFVTDGDMDFERELIETFLSDSRNQVAALGRAILGENWEEARQRAHSIKGSSANVGAVRMQAAAGRLEQIADARNASIVSEVLAGLQVEFDRAYGFLRDHMDRPDSPYRQGTLPDTPDD